MTNTTGKINLLGLTQPEMEQFFESIGEKRFRAGQVMKWIHHFGVDDFAAMTNVGKANISRAKTEARTIDALIRSYMLDSQLSTLDDMFDLGTLLLTPDDGGGSSGPYFQKADDLNDPWGNAYMIRIPGEINFDWDIVSAGEDGKFDTEDDVTN